MNYSDFSPSNQLVLAAISVKPDLTLLTNIIAKIDDWDAASEKLIKKGVAPLLLDILKKHPELVDSENVSSKAVKTLVPGHVNEKLIQTYLKTVTRSLVMYDTFREIAEALNHKGIKAVALKGVYLAEHLYPQIGLRQFSDIDLLVQEEDVNTVLDVFTTLGFVLEEKAFSKNVNHIHESAHLPHLMRKGISVEVHTRLHGPFNEYDLPTKELFDRAVPVKINSVPFYVFELHDLFLHLCIHIDKHINSTHIQFYSFADIARLLSIHYHELDWDILMSRSKIYKCEKVLINQLWLSNILFNAPLPLEITQGLTDWGDPELLKRLNDHLNDETEYKPSTSTHLKYLKRINSPLRKLLYLLEVIFPSKQLLLRAYKIKKPKLFWLWYPYRWYIGLKGLFMN